MFPSALREQYPLTFGSKIVSPSSGSGTSSSITNPRSWVVKEEVVYTAAHLINSDKLRGYRYYTKLIILMV